MKVTRPVRTIVDLAGVLDEEALEVAFESARRLRIVTHERVAARLDEVGGRGRVGAAQLHRVLAATEGEPAAESRLEVKIARLLRATDLPRPVRQHWITVFGQRYRLDFAWPEIRVALEPDGRKFHEFQRDRTRWRKLGATGWRVLPVTWHDVTRDWSTVVRELSAALSTPA
jgi:very-short-patch-repair endonuclease